MLETEVSESISFLLHEADVQHCQEVYFFAKKDMMPFWPAGFPLPEAAADFLGPALAGEGFVGAALL